MTGKRYLDAEDQEVHKTVNSNMPENFMRSANAPEINAGVIMANIS